VSINVIYNNEYIEGENVTRFSVGRYEKEFVVKDKGSNINMTFVIDGVEQEIGIEIKAESVEDKISSFLDRGRSKIENFMAKLKEFSEKYKWIIIMVVGLFFILVLILVFLTLINSSRKKQKNL